jgi:hypothetical protein
MTQKEARNMDEKTAYKWAAEILRPISEDIGPHKGQSIADDIVRAIMVAYRRGKRDFNGVSPTSGQTFEIYRAIEEPPVTAKELRHLLWEGRTGSEWAVREVPYSINRGQR